MNPLLLVPVAIWLYKALVKSTPEVAEVPNDKIFTNFLIEYRQGDSLSILKQRITKSINRVIKNCKHFKIGKSGSHSSRLAGYKKYDAMYLLCQSDNAEIIEQLEAYYNAKYINHKKNDNKKQGSAGQMSETDGVYYLYIVVA